MPVPRTPEMCRIKCGHCFETFQFDNSNHYLPRCPHCLKVSSNGSKARRKGIVCFILAILFLCMGIGVATGTFDYSKIPGGIYTSYAVVFMVTVYLFARTFYYCQLKVSRIDDSI